MAARPGAATPESEAGQDTTHGDLTLGKNDTPDFPLRRPAAQATPAGALALMAALLRGIDRAVIAAGFSLLPWLPALLGGWTLLLICQAVAEVLR